jgi:hypothetical protein
MESFIYMEIEYSVNRTTKTISRAIMNPEIYIV